MSVTICVTIIEIKAIIKLFNFHSLKYYKIFYIILQLLVPLTAFPIMYAVSPSSSNFFRAFRNEYNMTPRQYYDFVAREVVEEM